MNPTRRDFLTTSAATLAMTTSVSSLSCLAADPDPSVLGQGSFRFRRDMDWTFKAEATPVPVKDCHELVLTKSGNLVMCTNHTKNNLVIFAPDGKIIKTFGTTYPGAHGLDLVDENGTEFLWLTDTDRRLVVKLDMEGKEVMTLGWPKETGKYAAENKYSPTETAVNPANGDLYVADGYGSNWLIHYSAKGEIKGAYQHPGFSNIHGVAYDGRDPKNPKLLVTSRAANKLFTLSLAGENLGHVDLPGAWICRPVVRGENVFFAVINSGRTNWGSDFRGFVMVLDRNNQPVSLIGGQPPKADGAGDEKLYRNLEPKPFMNCHDVTLDAAGNLYVAHWASKQSYPYKLTPVQG